MINFEKKTNIFANFQASPEEWDGIKNIMKLAADPVTYRNSDLEQCTGSNLPLSEIQNVSERLQNMDVPPIVLGKGDIQTILAVCQNIQDSGMNVSSLDNQIVSNIETQMQQHTTHDIFKVPSVS